MITRPIIPIIFSQPIPRLQRASRRFQACGRPGGHGDSLAVESSQRMIGHWILGAGPVFEFPTSTNDALGAQQYSVGPAVVVGYKTKSVDGCALPELLLRGRRSQRPEGDYAHHEQAESALCVYLQPARCMAGRAQSDHQLQQQGLLSGNKWDVPVGLFAAKTIALGGVPFKIQAGLEYSVVSPDAFGKRANFRFVLTPVIPGLVQKPIFGGR